MATITKNESFDTNARAMGKNVKDTEVTSPGSKEPFATGKNVIERDTRKHKVFGKLGAKGWC